MFNLLIRLKNNIQKAFKSIFKTTAVSLMVIIPLMIVSIVIGTTMIGVLTINDIANESAKNLNITVFMKANVSERLKTIENPNKTAKEKTIPNPDYLAIEKAIKKNPLVDKIKFSSKDTQLKSLTKEYGTVWSENQLNNPLMDVYIVSVKTPTDLVSVGKQIKKIKNVDSVNTGNKHTQKLIKLSVNTRYISVVVITVLCVIGGVLIFNAIKNSIYHKRYEIITMRLIGSTRLNIIEPFLFEGIILSVVSLIIPSIVIKYLYTIMYNSLNPSLKSELIYLASPNSVVPKIMLLLTLIILFTSIISTNLAILKYTSKKMTELS